ncbi:MAG: heavy-metal-associated domain-containing protein [Flavobacteriales bacterium]|nr:heavy-metal-associated domain-containing protein [Flavobacteriales bacterium]
MSTESFSTNSFSDNRIIVANNTKTETFKVFGNCGMCERTIESSLANIKGIEKADWNKETKMMKVIFDEKQISLDEIKQKIAEVGYDTDKFRATEKVYNNLPGCCQYDRPAKKKSHNSHNGHKH